MAKFKVTVQTSKLGSQVQRIVEIADEDLEHYSEQDLERDMEEEMHKMISWDFQKLD